MSETATVAIKYVNPRKEGKKFGNVKDAAGALFWFPQEMDGAFSAGSTVSVEWKADKWGDTPVKIITRILGASGAPSQPAKTDAARAAYSTGPRPANSDRNIFVTGIVGRAMGSGKFGAEDIRQLTAMAKDAFEAHVAA